MSDEAAASGCCAASFLSSPRTAIPYTCPMRKTPAANPGTIHRLDFDSTLLRGNTPGDPTRRTIAVYTPYGYDAAQRYPLLLDLVGYTGSGLSHTNWKPFGYSLPERLDRLIGEGIMPPVVAVLPDCFTAYGGNQYINSTATGPYMDYLCEEIVPFVEERFSAGGSREQRGVFGKSSGGYGALLHGMVKSDVWGAIACHSGDAYFEYCYFVEIPQTLAMLAKHEESVTKFLNHVWSNEKIKHDEGMALMFLGMAAHYDPDPAAEHGFQLPFDVHTGAVRWDRWERWLRWDPVRLVHESLAALRSLQGIYIDCGSKDQFHLLWGARQLHAALAGAGIAHEYHEFDDDHSDVDYRMDISLPWMAAVLGG